MANPKDKRKVNLVKKSAGKEPNFFQSFAGVVLALLLLVGIYALIQSGGAEEKIPISEIAREVKLGNITNIEIDGASVSATYKDGKVKYSKKEDGVGISETLQSYGTTPEEISKVVIEVKSQSGFIYWIFNLSPILFPILFIGVFIWMMTRQVKGAGMQMFSFGQSRARITTRALSKNSSVYACHPRKIYLH